jgi:hypothetical protein
MQSETPPLTPLQTLLQRSLECSRIIEMIDEVLLALSQKRTTLEEKTIAEYFHRIVGTLCTVLSLLHSCLLETGRGQPAIAPEHIQRLQIVNENVRNRIEELLKIVNYNMNHLEQYFEYDYCAKLIEEPGFLQEYQEVIALLHASTAAK